MRILFTAFILLLTTFYSSSQFSEHTEAYPSRFVFGTSLHHLFSSNNEARRYSVKNLDNGNYTSTSNKHRSSLMFQFTGEFQFTYWFVRAGFGVRTEHASIEAHHTEEFYNYYSGQTYDTRVDRVLHINEKTTSQMLSIEAGSYFFKRDRPIRVGMGIGFDFCRYLRSESTGLNQVNREERIYLNSFSEDDEISDSKHLKGSKEWGMMVQDLYMPLAVPKISLKASYRIHDKLSASLQARMRLVVLQRNAGKPKTVFEFPVGVGIHYHFVN